MNVHYRIACLAALMLVAVAGNAGHGLADQALATTTQGEQRYEFLPHSYTIGGVSSEIFVKLDQFTGKTWRYDATLPKWRPIADPADALPAAGEATRYELHSHDYVVGGEARELLLRVDLMSGRTWSYNGSQTAWTKIEDAK